MHMVQIQNDFNKVLHDGVLTMWVNVCMPVHIFIK